MLTGAADISEKFFDLHYVGNVWNQNDVPVLWFGSNVVELSHINVSTEAKCDHLRLNNSFQQIGLSLPFDIQTDVKYRLGLYSKCTHENASRLQRLLFWFSPHFSKLILLQRVCSCVTRGLEFNCDDDIMIVKLTVAVTHPWRTQKN